MSTVKVARSPLPEEIDRYRGKWIAIRNGEVVASADELDDLLEDEKVRPDDGILRVPQSGTYFF